MDCRPHPDRRPSLRQQQDAAQPPLQLQRRESRPPRHSSRSLFQTSPLTDRLSVSHLRRSDLAGWRTRSLFPTRDVETSSNPVVAPLQSFLPVLKLRGLPYFCSKRHVLVWFGDLASHVVDLFFVAEVDPLNTGFAIVTLDSPQTALNAWRTLHKKPIVGKRFVEVFGLFPPQCPLSRRDSISGKQGLIPLPPGLEPMAAAAGETASPPPACPFCGLALGVHSDEGAAALATARMRECVEQGALAGQRAEALMHTAFLSVPALLYQDAGAVSRAEVELFDPESRRGRGYIKNFADTREVSLTELEKAAGLPPTTASPVLFFDLNGIQDFDMRALLCETVRLLHEQGPKSIAEIGNELSTRARAYLFLTELKLRNVVDSFPDIFMFIKPSSPSGSYAITLRGEAKREGVNAIRRMEPFQLTKRRRNRNNDGSNQRNNRRLPPLERNLTQQSENPTDLPDPLVALQRAQTAHRRESMADHHIPRLRPLMMDNRAASYAYSGAPQRPARSSWIPHEDDEGSLGAFANDYTHLSTRDSWAARGPPPLLPSTSAQRVGPMNPNVGRGSSTNYANQQMIDNCSSADLAALTDLIRSLSVEHDDSSATAIPSSAGQGGPSSKWNGWTPPSNPLSHMTSDRSATTTAGGDVFAPPPNRVGSRNIWPNGDVGANSNPPANPMLGKSGSGELNMAEFFSGMSSDRGGQWPRSTVHVPAMWDQSEQVLLDSLKEKQDEIKAIQRALAHHRNQMAQTPFIASGWGVGRDNNGSAEDDSSPLGTFASAVDEGTLGLLPENDVIGGGATSGAEQSLLANLAEILSTWANSPSGATGGKVPLRVVEGTLEE